MADAGLTREQLADRLDKSDTSVDNWLDGKTRPTRRNVASLADALADNRADASARRMGRDVMLQLILARLADLLVPFIGRKRVVEFGAALNRFAHRITENVESMNRPPLEENPTAEVVALAHGSAHPSTIPLLEDLASVETDPIWKRCIMAASVSWDAAFQHIAIEASLSRTAAGLAQDVPDVSSTSSHHLGNDRSLGAAGDMRRRMMRASSIDYLPRIIRGGIGELTRTLKNGIALRRELVRDFPTDPEAHFNLGSFLGMLGKRTGRRDLIDEGIMECRIAALLLPEWDAPAVEPAIMLANFGAYEESLQELNWAKSVLPAPTPHLQYCFGYTLMMLDRYDEALPHLKAVLDAKPDYALALRDAARCSFKSGDHKNGARYAKLAWRFGDPVEYDLWRSGAYTKRKTRG